MSFAAITTSGLLLLCPAFAHAQGGVPIRTNIYQGPQLRNAGPPAIAEDDNGNVFVTGFSSGSDGYAYYTSIKYSSSVPPPVHLDFQLLNNELALSWTNAGFSLQSAPAVTGAFTNLPGSTSPYTNVTTGAQQFFRLIGN